jgi:glycyl-radical enzyme activating protein
MWCCNPESQLSTLQLSFEAGKCTNCLKCVSSCKTIALQNKNGKLEVNFSKCDACGDCIDECPTDALKIYGWETDAESLLKDVINDSSYFENSGGGITLSGGDPVFQPEFTCELLSQAKNMGLHTCIETAGHCTEDVMKAVAEFTDLFLFDFKHYKAADHLKFTSVTNELILSNLKMICLLQKPVILRCPVIPEVNNSLQHFEKITEISNKYSAIQSVEIMPFHDWGFHKYKQIGQEYPKINSSTVPEDTVQSWIEGLKKLGCTKIKRG